MSKYFRNKEDLIAQDEEFVEAGCLWEFSESIYTLVDDDRYVTSTDHTAFAKA